MQWKGPSEVALCLRWDRDGCIEIVPNRHDPTISGPRSAWVRFIGGEISAARSLLSAELPFDGRIGQIARYSMAFNDLAGVARALPTRGVGQR